jgi:hypothetical protein
MGISSCAATSTTAPLVPLSQIRPPTEQVFAHACAMYEYHGSVGAPIVLFDEDNNASRNSAQPSANPARRRSRPSRRAAASSLSIEQTSPTLLAGVMNSTLPLKPSLEARMQGTPAVSLLVP